MSNVDRTSNAVIGHLSGVSLLVPVRTTSSVGWGRNTIKANASVVGLLVPVRKTTNVDRARKAVIANATVVRPLVSVRPTTSVMIGEDCCGGVCLSYCVWSGGAIVGTNIILAIIISIVFCRCCACCS